MISKSLKNQRSASAASSNHARRLLRLEALEPRILLSITSEEQLFVYLLNRARSNPQTYETEAELSVSLAGVDPQPPLAVNDLLFDSAEFHSEEMAANNYFGHQSEVTGDWPNKMALDAGYNLPFGPDSNQIESIAAGIGNVAPDTAAKVLKLFIEDIGVPGAGHRRHLLAMDAFWQQHREIGAGYAVTDSARFSDYWTVHTAYVNPADLFLTGVIFNDLNSNQMFDRHEGISGVTISTDQGPSTVTNAAGGWSLPVTPGAYVVMASGDDFTDISSSAVVVDDANIEIDFISSEPAGIVNFGLNDVSGLPEVSITADDPSAAEKQTDIGTFTLTRTGATDTPLTVNYLIRGTAQNGSDYNTLATSAVIPMGASSTAITVTPIDDDDIEGRETVTLTLLADIEYQFGAATAATVNIDDDEGIIVTLGDGIASTVTFSDPDQTAAAVKLKSGVGSIVFLGESLASRQVGAKIVVAGGVGASIDQITLDNTSPSTSLSFKATGGAEGLIEVNNITINGSARNIKAKKVNLTGDLTVTGGLQTLRLNDVADQRQITIGGPDLPASTLSAKFNNVTDLTFNSDTPLKSLTVNNWQDNDPNPDTITGPWLKKLIARQNFAADLTLTDDSAPKTLGNVKVKGSITGGTWNIDGSGGKISAFDIDDDWSAVFTGNLAGLSTKSDAAGHINALSIKAISVKGNYTDAVVNLTQPLDPDNPKLKTLGKLIVKGTMENVEIRSLGHIGKVASGRILDSNIYAGVDGSVTGLPASDTQFNAQASIAAVKIKGIKTENIWLRAANIAAYNLGPVSVGYAQTDNDGVEFGIAAHLFQSITYKDDNLTIKARNLDDILAFSNFDDLVIRIL